MRKKGSSIALCPELRREAAEEIKRLGKVYEIRS